MRRVFFFNKRVVRYLLLFYENMKFFFYFLTDKSNIVFG